ncbi:ABC transporter ATP-binding protein [Arthrobacter sp. RT-1]|uniref:ATP-binding cassette domain-containing protein n=1 Tax=Arthrobacter sp. RT-1 TaxID=2292263 RepID=UPI0015F1B934|nr:ABC transporter ATP-binding protein [Arthrobacter sp. RT-1]
MNARTVLKLTWPYVARLFRARYLSVASLVALGLVGGLVATMKSLLESAVIDQAASALNARDAAVFWQGTFNGWPRAADATDWGEQILALLNGVTLTITTVGALYVIVMVASITLSVLAVRIRETINVELFRHMFGDGLRAYMETGGVERGPNEPGGVTGAVQQGASAISGAWAVAVTSLQQLATLISVVALVGSVHPLFASTFVIVALALAGVSQLQASRLARQRQLFDEQRKDLLARTDDVLSYRDVLLAHERDGDYVRRLAFASEGLASLDRKLSIRESVFQSFQGVIFDVGRLVAVGLVVVAVAAGTDLGAVGDIYFFISIYSRLLGPVMALLAGYDSVRRSTSMSDYLLRLLRQWTTTRSDARPPEPPQSGHDPVIRMSEVTYRYPDQESGPVLSRCSFEVPRGGTTLLIGRSGAGKTTLARIALGFLVPDQGIVEIFGAESHGLDRAVLGRMSYLAQTRHFVEGTVQDNLFAADAVSVAEQAAIIQQVGLAQTQDGAIALLAEEARGLSEGQKQRLALARILVDRSELAILDEPLSGVDALTLSEIEGPMQAWLANPARTVLVISHRLEFALFAGHVVILDGGSVIEEGDPQLLRSDPRSMFRRMWDADRRFE